MPIHAANLRKLVDEPDLLYTKTYTSKSSAANHRAALLEAAERMNEFQNNWDLEQDSFQIVTRKEDDEGTDVYVVYAKYQPSTNDGKVDAA